MANRLAGIKRVADQLNVEKNAKTRKLQTLFPNEKTPAEGRSGKKSKIEGPTWNYIMNCTVPIGIGKDN